MVNSESQKAGTTVAVTQGGAPPAVIQPRKIDRYKLKDSITKKDGSYEDGLRDTRVGAQLLYAWRTRTAWVLERTEDITIAVDGWTARNFTVDFEAPSQEPVNDSPGLRLLPLAALPHDVRDVIARDENGQYAPTLARVEQQQAVGSMLCAAAENLLGQPPETPVAQALKLLAVDGNLAGFKAAHPDTQDVKTLSDSPDFNELAESLGGCEFVCLRTDSSYKGRHVVRVGYQDAVMYQEAVRPVGPLPERRLTRLWAQLKAGLRRLSAQLGWRPTVLYIELTDLHGARHWRFDIAAPDGAELQKAQLTGQSGDGSSRKEISRQLTLTYSPRPDSSTSRHPSLEVDFRVSRQWRSWVLINAVIITVLLFAGAFRIGFVTGRGGGLSTRDLTAAFLLGINGAFAGILARPTEDTLTSIFLRGVRTAISVLGLLAFVAVATLAYGPSGHALFLVWIVLAAISGVVCTIVLVGAGAVDRW